jgi:hypothetical protein
MKDVKDGRILFNSLGNQQYFKEEEIDYIVDSMKSRGPDFERANMVEAFHRKACDTLAGVMRDLNLSNHCMRIVSIHSEVSLQNTLAIL